MRDQGHIAAAIGFPIGLILGTLLAVSGAFGAPPEGASPELAPWFQGLMRPDTGTSCCSMDDGEGGGDCRAVESRIAGGHYEALIEGGEWLPIPAEKIIHPKTNPIGRAVLCMARGSGHLVYCFAPPLEVRRDVRFAER